MLGGSPAEPAAVYSWQFGGKATKLASSSSASWRRTSSRRPPQRRVPVPARHLARLLLPAHLGRFVLVGGGAAAARRRRTAGRPARRRRASTPASTLTSRGSRCSTSTTAGRRGVGVPERSRGAWGIVDIDDVCAGAKYLVEKGLADPKASPSTAGRRAGTRRWARSPSATSSRRSLYGVADSGALAEDTPNLRSLLGRRAEVARGPRDLRRARADQRGGQAVVPDPAAPGRRGQDRAADPGGAAHAALLKKGLPCALKIAEDERTASARRRTLRTRSSRSSTSTRRCLGSSRRMSWHCDRPPRESKAYRSHLQLVEA